MTATAEKLMQFYHAMLDHYGPQHWWPANSPFEVITGAILTQNTNWTNVEKAIKNLKQANVMTPHKMNQLSTEELAQLIRPAGYFNLKSKRLKNFLHWFCGQYDGSIDQLKDLPIHRLREELLSIKGIGPETADSILLYALNKPTFVIDTYTYRILVRHHCIDPESDYHQIKDTFESNLPDDTPLFNEFHALLVQVGKNHCKPRPKCQNCPLEQFEHCTEQA